MVVGFTNSAQESRHYFVPVLFIIISVLTVQAICNLDNPELGFIRPTMVTCKICSALPRKTSVPFRIPELALVSENCLQPRSCRCIGRATKPGAQRREDDKDQGLG